MTEDQSFSFMSEVRSIEPEKHHRSPRLKVGRSAIHTPIKHGLLDAELGRQLGAARLIHWIKRYAVIDTCGGDGAANAFSGASSPQIILKHLQKAPAELTVKGFIIEKDPATYALLQQNIRDDLVTLIYADYRSDEIAQRIGPWLSWPNTAVFLHIDPNHAYDVELAKSFRTVLPDATTMLVTLGCNPHGIKRLAQHVRKKCLDRIEYLLSVKRPRHDAALIVLTKDASQWAYFLTIPRDWRQKTQNVIERLESRHWPKGIESYWFSDSEETFWRAGKRLFLKVDGSEKWP